MAITIIAKIISAEVKAGVASIVIEFDDGKGKWQKIYTNSQTEPMDFLRFKDRIIADLRQDLKVKDQLANIATQVGKTFTITI